MEFVENDAKFKICNILHVKYVTYFCAVFGIVATGSIFLFGIVVFPWSLYENSVDITAMLAFTCFLIGGTTVHILVINGLQKTRFRYMIPAVLYQAFLMCLITVTSLIATGELVSEGNLSNRDETMAKIVLCICPTTFVLQSLMLAVIYKCRYYIQCKRRHIRNGLPPPVREVIMFTTTNKVSSSELSVSEAYQLAEEMMPERMNEIRRDCDSA